MKFKLSIYNQIRNNSLAIISLVVAIIALSYNTYRNELTEVNRNIRNAGFEVLKELNQLQLLVNYSHYDKSKEHGNPIQGWAHISYIQDMSQLISTTVLVDADKLNLIWKDNWQTLKTNELNNKNITVAIDQLRTTIRQEIKALR